MATCTFKNLTPKQAKTLAKWFSEQGEQSCDVWFDVNNVDPPSSHSIVTQKNGDVIVYCEKEE